MKYKTSELVDGLLDAAVSKARGLPFRVSHQVWPDGSPSVLVVLEQSPSSNWAHGGPIIHDCHISVECYQDTARRSNMRDVFWIASLPGGTCLGFERDGNGEGETALVAAMRCFVHATFGDEVDL